METLDIDEAFMREALAEAKQAAAVGEVPIGAIVVQDGAVIARAHNRRELEQDPSAHAEFLALCDAAKTLGRWRLSDCTVYVTLEPCPMCAGLMVNARVGRCVYGATDTKGGALGSLYRLQEDSRLNHAFPVTKGVLADECAALLKMYFSSMRRGRDLSLAAHDEHENAKATSTARPSSAGFETSPICSAPAPRVLVAMDSFKGCASSEAVEDWVAAGVHRACPHASIARVRLADGGEGTLEAFRDGCGGTLESVDVEGPLGQPVEAQYLMGPADEHWAVVEMARAAGIGYSACTQTDALHASTYGVGQLILRAVERGARRIYIGLGGSATTDGGAGALQALGAAVLDDRDRPVPRGLAGLERVATIDLTPARNVLADVELVLLCDVTNPLVGKRGTVAVFGGQKGLPVDDAAARERCDAWMVRYGRALDAARANAPDGRGAERYFKTVLGVPGAGAAGGLGAALLALGARMRSGVDELLDAVDFDARVEGCDLVITGEGHMDGQSVAGKAPIGVARRAKKHGKPVVAIVGGRAHDLADVYRAGVDLVIPACSEPMALDRAMEPEQARANLADAGETAVRALLLSTAR